MENLITVLWGLIDALVVLLLGGFLIYGILFNEDEASDRLLGVGFVERWAKRGALFLLYIFIAIVILFSLNIFLSALLKGF